MRTPTRTPTRLVLRDKAYLARGKRGIAYTATLHGNAVLVKERNPSAAVDTIRHEAEMLRIVNKARVGPLLIGMQDGALIREYVEGEEIEEWIAHAQKRAIKLALLDVLEQCRRLDLLGINKLEMTHPHKHLLVRRGRVVMIDFERARKTAKPKNVTQACQWLTGGRLSQTLLQRGIAIDREATLAHAKAYKRAYDEPAFARIKEMVRDA